MENANVKLIFIHFLLIYFKLMISEGKEQTDEMQIDEVNPYCNVVCKINKNKKHTNCPCNKAFAECTIAYTGREVRLREIMINKHNELRNQIALGEETRANMEGVTAANMEVINYDMELETIALCHARRCTFEHDTCRDKLLMHKEDIWVGQNLGWYNIYFEHSDEQDTRTIKLIQNMYDEFNFASDMFPDFIDRFESSQEEGTGHLTQIIWATTREIGCAVSYNAKNKSDWMLTCVYYPGGNIKGFSVFKKGPPAHKCRRGLFRNKKYLGLCGELKPIPAGKYSLTFKEKKPENVTTSQGPQKTDVTKSDTEDKCVEEKSQQEAQPVKDKTTQGTEGIQESSSTKKQSAKQENTSQRNIESGGYADLWVLMLLCVLVALILGIIISLILYYGGLILVATQSREIFRSVY